ncbi:MAG: trypsin-like peptidase domain-containing protein [Pirellulales bacterium]
MGAVFGAALAFYAAGASSATALAQADFTQPLYRPEVREQLYQQLYRDVDALEKQGNVLKTVVKLVGPTVVHIEAQRSEGSRVYGRSRTVEEAGSGVILEMSSKLYVLTNRHVIRDAALGDIDIGLSDGREIHPECVWADKDTDVAVMAVNNATGLVAARLGDSDKVEIGDFAIAVGSPFGLSHSVTYGIISAKGRRDLELGDGTVRFQDFLQTDAAINPGNSGGPLISLRGEVIGINTAIASNSGGNEGIGFSIPINMAMTIAKQLVETGAVSRAFLGVTLDSKFNSDTATKLGLPRRVGAHVIRITPGSPAESSAIQVGDVILTFNGIPIDNDSHLVNIISLTKVGTQVPVGLFRSGKTLELKTVVGDYDQFLRTVEAQRAGKQ